MRGVSPPTICLMDDHQLRRTAGEIRDLAASGLDWVTLSGELSETIARAVAFDRCCWHTVDPGTVLFTGSVNRGITCSGSWLAEHEYVVEDVNNWWFLARSGRRAGATSIATHGDPMRSARHRSREARNFGIADELRGSFVVDGAYWAAAGFMRDRGQPWFSEDEVRFLAALSEPIAEGFRRALLHAAVAADVVPAADGPGVVVFDEHGAPELISPAAEHWIAEMVEDPAPATAAESKMVQAVAARARTLAAGGDPLPLAARSRVQTRSGEWLLLYGTPLAGGAAGRTAVIVQPAPAGEVAPLVALAYGLSPRECQIVRLCLEGRSTKQMAAALHVSAYTVQDHLKSIFEKTGVCTRNELVGQVFLEHYIPRWEDLDDLRPGWTIKACAPLPEQV